MSCGTDKFVINKGVDNEFVLTIKQTGTTLPMEIVSNETNKEIVITPTVTYVPYSAEVPYIAPTEYQAAVVGQEYIAAIEGKVEKYSVYAGSLTNDTTYSLQINTTTIDVLYNVVTYPDVYEYLLEVANQINADATINGIVSVIVDSNTLKLEGVTEGDSYTVNGSNMFNIVETQTAVTGQAGQSYIAAQDEVLADPGQEYTAAVQPHYLATNDTIAVNLGELIEGLVITNIKVQPEVAVTSVNGITVPTNSWYDIGTTTAFDVVPVTNTDQLDEPLANIVLRIKLTLDSTVDTFEAYLIKASDDSTVLTKSLTIENTRSGKIKLSITDAEAATLESSKGDAVDRYYLRPTYRLMIDCNTVNNGAFIAKVPEVYVE